jgi:crotonobetainyl-CoA:carnitine CoA-transferase CaiB-like acyl-CoA transferase
VSGPLEGLRVIEMGSLIAGPFCGQLMGDMGADVIKIEAPGEGDPMRQWGQGAKPAWWRVIGAQQTLGVARSAQATRAGDRA